MRVDAGPLIETPQRVGYPLTPPLALAYSASRGTFRILYLVNHNEHAVNVNRHLPPPHAPENDRHSTPPDSLPEYG
ncbi:hypothetical protein [Rhodococcus erythropolis]|uniref:hypothetical protein n=1 Tax=Rhodococcus erythropolis TaxID=1833 RepID=UPI003013724E